MKEPEKFRKSYFIPILGVLDYIARTDETKENIMTTAGLAAYHMIFTLASTFSIGLTLEKLLS